jgi:hypothetical protein
MSEVIFNRFFPTVPGVARPRPGVATFLGVVGTLGVAMMGAGPGADEGGSGGGVLVRVRFRGGDSGGGVSLRGGTWAGTSILIVCSASSFSSPMSSSSCSPMPLSSSEMPCNGRGTWSWGIGRPKDWSVVGAGAGVGVISIPSMVLSELMNVGGSGSGRLTEAPGVGAARESIVTSPSIAASSTLILESRRRLSSGPKAPLARLGISILLRWPRLRGAGAGRGADDGDIQNASSSVFFELGACDGCDFLSRTSFWYKLFKKVP